MKIGKLIRDGNIEASSECEKGTGLETTRQITNEKSCPSPLAIPGNFVLN